MLASDWGGWGGWGGGVGGGGGGGGGVGGGGGGGGGVGGEGRLINLRPYELTQPHNATALLSIKGINQWVNSTQ